MLVDRFLEDAFEADVDALSDGTNVVIGAVMEHIESAGIHSGDSACALPSYLIPPKPSRTMKQHTIAFAKALGVVGLINVQYAYKDGRSVRHRSESACVPHGAVCVEGDWTCRWRRWPRD